MTKPTLQQKQSHNSTIKELPSEIEDGIPRAKSRKLTKAQYEALIAQDEAAKAGGWHDENKPYFDDLKGE